MSVVSIGHFQYKIVRSSDLSESHNALYWKRGVGKGNVVPNRLIEQNVFLKNNTNHLWLSPRDAEEAVTDCYTVLRELFKQAGKIEFRLSGDTLALNGAPIDLGDALARSFANHLRSRNAYDFVVGTK